MVKNLILNYMVIRNVEEAWTNRMRKAVNEQWNMKEAKPTSILLLMVSKYTRIYPLYVKRISKMMNKN